MNIKFLSENATMPTHGSDGAAGYDLYSANTDPVAIPPGVTVMISTDIAMEIPDGYFGAVYPRSGLSVKEGLQLQNSVGIIDSDYRGNIKVALHNNSEKVRIIEPKERIAQIIFQSYATATFHLVTDLSDTERGAGGFGSTGKN